MLSRILFVTCGAVLSWITMLLTAMPAPGLAMEGNEAYYPWCRDQPEIKAELLPGFNKTRNTECLIGCPNDRVPVCGTDEHQYVNECSLCRAACIKLTMDETLIEKQCDGTCPCNEESDGTYHRKRPRYKVAHGDDDDDEDDDDFDFAEMEDEL